MNITLGRSKEHTGMTPSARLTRWMPRLIFVGAVGHLTVGMATDGSLWRTIFSEGLWSTVADADPVRTTAMWFMLGGVAFLSLGLLTRRAVIATGTVPAESGWALLALGIPVSVLQPASGGWFLIFLGVLALWAARQPSESR